MKAQLAIVPPLPILSIASEQWTPPRSFMCWFFADRPMPSVQCLADRNAPDNGHLFVFDWNHARDKKVVVGHPSTWAACGAFNLASAYRPEGL